MQRHPHKCMICHPGRSVPGSLPNKQVTIESSANIYPSSKGSYNVSVLNPIPIVTSITPGSFSEGMAQIVVNGSSFVYGAQILWNGVAIPTTYLSGTQLVAIVTENIPGTYPVTVVNPNPGSASSQRIKRTGFSRPGSHPATADRNQCPGQQHHHHYFGSNPYLGLMG